MRIVGLVISGIVSGMINGFLFVGSLLLFFEVLGKIILMVIRNRMMLLEMEMVFVCRLRNVRIFLFVNRNISIIRRVISNFCIMIVCCFFGLVCFSMDMKIGRFLSGFIIRINKIVVEMILFII